MVKLHEIPARRYVVTGCAGFIGSHLVETLLALGHHVTGVDNFSDYYARTSKDANLEHATASPRFELITDDLARADLVDLFSGTSGVFHLAAQPGVRGSWGETFDTYTRDNVLATQRVFDAAARQAIRVVWASSSSIYGDAESYPTVESQPGQPLSPYGVTKLTCEHLSNAYHQAFGLTHVGLRYFTVYGPRQRPDMAFHRILSALLDDTSFTLFGSGQQSRDVTYVADAVSATIAAMERGVSNRIYNVGGGSEISLNEVIAIAESAVGRQLRRTNVAPAAGDVRRTAADTTLAQRDLGWTPQVPIQVGIRNQLAECERRRSKLLTTTLPTA